jgi:hypothetical protein
LKWPLGFRSTLRRIFKCIPGWDSLSSKNQSILNHLNHLTYHLLQSLVVTYEESLFFLLTHTHTHTNTNTFFLSLSVSLFFSLFLTLTPPVLFLCLFRYLSIFYTIISFLSLSHTNIHIYNIYWLFFFFPLCSSLFLLFSFLSKPPLIFCLFTYLSVYLTLSLAHTHFYLCCFSLSILHTHISFVWVSF